MTLSHRPVLAACAVGMFAIVAAAESPPAGGGWLFDRVHLKNGSSFPGLILDETPATVRFQSVRQSPGRPTVFFLTTFSRGEIDRVEKLSDAERDRLKSRLAELDRSGQDEKLRMERLELEPIAWAGKADAGRRYRSDYFTLDTDAPEPVARRAAVRLEQIYTAYTRFLPPRGEARRPTAIVLMQSRAEYRELLKAEGRKFVNVAFFDPAGNRVVCASDLDRLGDDLERAKQKNMQLRADLDKQESTLSKLYKGKELAQLLQPIRRTRAVIDAGDKYNDGVFDRATEQLFATLYHEAFHAYLAGFAYAPPQPELPRWLNEGLAQIFETAIVEAGELRIGHADRERLAKAKEAARKGDLVPLARLLESRAPQFLVGHDNDRAATGQHYLTAWAVAFHLTFERRLLGSAALESYLKALARGADPREAFVALVGQPLEQYERDFTRYLGLLQGDGTVAATKP